MFFQERCITGYKLQVQYTENITPACLLMVQRNHCMQGFEHPKHFNIVATCLQDTLNELNIPKVWLPSLYEFTLALFGVLRNRSVSYTSYTILLHSSARKCPGHLFE